MMTRESPISSPGGRLVAWGLSLWFLVALAVSLSGVLDGAPAPVFGVINWGLVLIVLGATYAVRALRRWVLTAPLRWLVLYHVVRFVGVAFLVMHARGELPAGFALHAGWGDIAVAVVALVVGIWAAPIAGRGGGWWTVLVWNGLGLLDILVVIGTGIRLGLADMGQMAAMTAFPFSLLPTLIVPLIIVTHVLIFVRLWHGPENRWGPAGA